MNRSDQISRLADLHPQLKLSDAELSVKLIIAAFIGATSFCATLAFHIARSYVEIVPSLSEWFINRNGFTIPFYGVFAFSGFFFLVAGRRGSKTFQFIAKIGDSVACFYASAAGSLFGWALGICAAALADNSGRYFWISILIIAMAFFTASAPLVVMVIARSTIETFNNRLFRDVKKEVPIQIIGVIAIVSAIVGFIYDWRT